MSARLRVGLAGLGTMGRNHLRNLVARDDVRLVALADPSMPARITAAEQASSARDFADPLAMLEEEQLDALIVAVPTTLHHRVALAAIERGVPVLVEKPLAATVDEARELVDAARAAGVVLQAGHIERFNPAVLALGERLRGGALSRIFSVKTVRGGPLPERIRDVGVAVDLATHDVDVICHLVGERPSRVYAETTQHVHTAHEDLLYGLLSFPGGTLATLDVNWLTPEKQRRVTVLGEEGMFVADYLSQSLTFTRGAADLAPTYLDGYAPTFAGETVHLPVEPAEPLRRELDAFFTAVRDGSPPVVGGEDGLWAVVLANLLLASATQHRPIDVALEEVPG
ncbi:MAG TPA: Gfo/Idh/MocA family oxidoreductase [Candidatus Limnocylindrales bacterium]|nr:Gfo/Idh/MocA family oxidoreductase [Candidatus Limnocylindrales bacterium]